MDAIATADKMIILALWMKCVAIEIIIFSRLCGDLIVTFQFPSSFYFFFDNETGVVEKSKSSMSGMRN
jgi:hypothetical protein